MFEKRALRRMCGAKKEEIIIKGWKKTVQVAL
jgi:hypothetical protein